MHDLDTALLRTFVTLAETRSFSRTGDRIGRSQSAVSAQIRKLETQLDCLLFERDKRNVQLTADGERLLGHARQLLRLADALFERSRQPDVEGEVRFGSPEDFATRYLPEILAAFSEAFPRVFLNVNCDLTLHLIDGFEADRYDLIVIKQDPARLYRNSRPLWREQLVWVGGPHFDRRTDFATLIGHEPITGLPLVLSPPPCVYRQRALTALDAAGVFWKVIYASPSFAGAVAAVRAGLGITVLPRTMVPQGLVVFDRQRGWPALRDAEIGLLAAERPAPATAALASFIEEHVPSDHQNR